MTCMGEPPSGTARSQGPLAGSPVQKESVNEPKCRDWGGGVVGDRRVGSMGEISRETRPEQNDAVGRKVGRVAGRESECP